MWVSHPDTCDPESVITQSVLLGVLAAPSIHKQLCHFALGNRFTYITCIAQNKCIEGHTFLDILTTSKGTHPTVNPTAQLWVCIMGTMHSARTLELSIESVSSQAVLTKVLPESHWKRVATKHWEVRLSSVSPGLNVNPCKLHVLSSSWQHSTCTSIYRLSKSVVRNSTPPNI